MDVKQKTLKLYECNDLMGNFRINESTATKASLKEVRKIMPYVIGNNWYKIVKDVKFPYREGSFFQVGKGYTNLFKTKKDAVNNVLNYEKEEMNDVLDAYENIKDRMLRLEALLK